MKTLFKVLFGLFALLVLVAFGGITYITQTKPDIAAPADLKVASSPEIIGRGEYLANHVTVCMDCHSARDWSLFSGPLMPSSLGKGGEKFDQSMGLPGSFVSHNITPFNLKSWSDGEIYRAITSGVGGDNHPIFPIMPYLNYGTMDSEDIHAIIAYLRSLPEQISTPEASKGDFPVNVIMHTMPQPAKPTKRPDPSDTLAYGAYMINAAACGECHTKAERGQKVGLPFAGGFVFQFPNGAIVRSANITPHDNALGKWTKEMFIARFKGVDPAGGYVPAKVDMDKAELQTVMPWTMYAGMSEQDLGAIYDYLRTVPAVADLPEKWSPPPARK